jgi:hypothetical protein
MTASWKIFAFAGGVTLAAAFGAACTVTTTPGGPGTGGDDDFFDDAGADTSTTPDTGSTTPSCAVETFSDGGSTDISLDPAGSGTTTCTTCVVAACCSQLTPCFQDPTGDCQDLESCLEAVVENPDAGVSSSDCADLHPDSVSLHNAWGDCQQTNCSAQCQ